MDQHSGDGQRRRAHIQQLISESQKSDEFQTWLTELYFGSSVLEPIEITDEQHWIAAYHKNAIRRDEIETRSVELEKELRSLDVQLDSIGDTDIQALRATKQNYITQRDRLNNTRIELEIELERLKERSRSLTATRNNLISRQKRGKGILARLDATRDIEQILKNSYARNHKRGVAKSK